jgi:hypothetical protein
MSRSRIVGTSIFLFVALLSCAPAGGTTGGGTAGGATGGGTAGGATGGGTAGGATGGGTATDGGVGTLPSSAFDGGCGPVYENLRRCGMATLEVGVALATERCNLGEFQASQQCLDTRDLGIPYDEVPLGGACTNGLQCGPGAWCEEVTCPGRCVVKKPIGARAQRTKECATGVVELQHCAAEPATGIPCDAFGQDCAPGYACLYATSSSATGRCWPYEEGSPGAACNATTLCRGSVCAGRTCRPAVVEDGACVSDGDCQVGLRCTQQKCVNSYSCALCLERCVVSGDGRSECAPFVAVGGVCADDLSCLPGNFCDASNECAAGLPAGSPCSSSGQCSTGLECNVLLDACAVPRRNVATGGSCVTGAECASGSCFGPIFEGRCVAVVSLGARCGYSNNLECSRGAYCDDATSTCMALRGGGQPCASLQECMSFGCSGGLCKFPQGDVCVVPR